MWRQRVRCYFYDTDVDFTTRHGLHGHERESKGRPPDHHRVVVSLVPLDSNPRQLVRITQVIFVAYAKTVSDLKSFPNTSMQTQCIVLRQVIGEDANSLTNDVVFRRRKPGGADCGPSGFPPRDPALEAMPAHSYCAFPISYKADSEGPSLDQFARGLCKFHVGEY